MGAGRLTKSVVHIGGRTSNSPLDIRGDDGVGNAHCKGGIAEKTKKLHISELGDFFSSRWLVAWRFRASGPGGALASSRAGRWRACGREWIASRSFDFNH